MTIRKLLATALALLMVVALVPAAALADGIGSVVDEASAMNRLETTWAAIRSVEADALASGADRRDVINAVYEAALNLAHVDSDSFSDFTEDGFFFTVNGMYCAYNYRLRNELDKNCAPVDEGIVVVKGEGNGASIANAEYPNVLLVAPYYGHDNSFTDQYKREAQSIAEATGGDYTLIQSAAATGPAIVENFTEKGVVIYDSHGSYSGTSSYLCLTTNEGITQQDYQNGWAVSAGGAAWIDGRYVENHVNGSISNCFVWMAICEGMMRQGQGTTGYALIRAGAGAVYGYSQSVTFAGDYVYEETFWNEMKAGATISEAYEVMVDTHGIPDPYGDAFPIVMSPVDDFPDNPDGPQVVNCDWSLFGGGDPVALTDFSLSEESVQIYQGYSATVNFAAVPDNANQYQLAWQSADENIAIVNGNNRKVTITGVAPGSTSVTCTVSVDGQTFGTAVIAVTVKEDTALFDALNVEGGSLQFTTGGEYPFVAVQDGDRLYAKSSNERIGDSVSSLTLTLDMLSGETLSFDYQVGSEADYDFYKFSVNGQQLQYLSGVDPDWSSYTFTAEADGSYTFEWSFIKDPYVNDGDDCVKIDNVAYSGDAGSGIIADGDVDGNGSVTIADAIFAMRIAMGVVTPTDEQLAHGDLDGDGRISTAEAIQIVRIAMGLSD